MIVFSLATAWVLWSLLLLSTSQRQALATPEPSEHHDHDAIDEDNYHHYHHHHHTQFYTTRSYTSTTFSAVLPAIASVEAVANVSANGEYGEGPRDLGFPTNATGLPPLCAVTVAVNNGSSNYRFGLFLPSASQWNGRLLTIGSYSFAGGINWPDMGIGPHYGFATLSSDNGHNASQATLDWNPTTPEKLADWGYRSLTGPVALSKLLTSPFPTTAPARRAGGRASRSSSHLDLPEFATLAAAVLAQCDHLDGHNDSIISRPDLCELDWAAIDCDVAASGAACLLTAQIATTKFMYADAYTAQGEFIHSGYELGSEAQLYVYLAFNDEADFDTLYERYWLYNDTAWNWTMYSDQTFYDSLRINPGNATADHYDISAFRDRGGKVLLYQGLADGVIMPRMTTYYYNQTMAAMNLSLSQSPGSKHKYYKSVVHPRPRGGSDDYERRHHKGGGREHPHDSNREESSTIQDFFRYFQVPGMHHCFTSPAAVGAPWMFAGAGQAALLYKDFHFGQGWGVPYQAPNASHDALLSLMAWVENATAPSSIVATIWNANGSIRRTRPLCVYPQEAFYTGTGDLNLAENWHCQ